MILVVFPLGEIEGATPQAIRQARAELEAWLPWHGAPGKVVFNTVAKTGRVDFVHNNRKRGQRPASVTARDWYAKEPKPEEWQMAQARAWLAERRAWFENRVRELSL